MKASSHSMKQDFVEKRRERTRFSKLNRNLQRAGGMKLEAYCIPEICNKCWKIIDDEKLRGKAMWQTCVVLTSEEKCCPKPNHFWSLFRSQGECSDSAEQEEVVSFEMDFEGCELMRASENDFDEILHLSNTEIKEDSSFQLRLDPRDCLLTKTVICWPQKNVTSVVIWQIMALLGLLTSTITLMIFIVRKMQIQKKALKESHSARLLLTGSPSVYSNYGIADNLFQEDRSNISSSNVSKLLSPISNRND
ncbi:unnamed protein product [Oikopleura dioica]|nr:unnamed protein product [Oikopleura dioica]